MCNFKFLQSKISQDKPAIKALLLCRGHYDFGVVYNKIKSRRLGKFDDRIMKLLQQTIITWCLLASDALPPQNCL